LPDSIAGAGKIIQALGRSSAAGRYELTTEGVAKADSVFDRTMRRHRVSFDLQSGSFDFDRKMSFGCA
jgi:hypothetical protein